jgi:outer membrane murein-binding lipoprotein Lpp
VPRPVEPGNVFALETGPPLRVAAVVRLDPRSAVDCLVEATGDVDPSS